MEEAKHDYKASVFTERVFIDLDVRIRWVLSYISKVTGERYYSTLEAENGDDARSEAARLLDIDDREIAVNG